MKWILVYFLGLFVVAQLLMGCTTPTKTLNLLTPDRLGLGTVDGSIDLAGKSSGWMDGYWENWDGFGHSGGWQGGQIDMDHKLEGDSTSTMVWLEWDFPEWKQPDDYDAYLRERIRTLNLEKDLMLKSQVIIETIEKLDKALEREAIYHRGDCCEPVWPLKLTEQY